MSFLLFIDVDSRDNQLESVEAPPWPRAVAQQFAKVREALVRIESTALVLPDNSPKKSGVAFWSFLHLAYRSAFSGLDCRTFAGRLKFLFPTPHIPGHGAFCEPLTGATRPDRTAAEANPPMRAPAACSGCNNCAHGLASGRQDCLL